MFGWTKHEPTYIMLQWTAFFGIKMYKLSTLMDMCWHTNMNREFSINETFEFLKREIKKKKKKITSVDYDYHIRPEYQIS
jgi:hypothetical protein